MVLMDQNDIKINQIDALVTFSNTRHYYASYCYGQNLICILEYAKHFNFAHKIVLAMHKKITKEQHLLLI